VRRSHFGLLIESRPVLPEHSDGRPASLRRQGSRDGLGFDEVVESFKTAFATETGMLHTAEGSFCGRAGTGVVTDMTEAEARDHSGSPVVTGSKDISGKSVFGAVSGLNHFFFRLKLNNGCQRTKRLIVNAFHFCRHATQDCRRKETAAVWFWFDGLRTSDSRCAI